MCIETLREEFIDRIALNVEFLEMGKYPGPDYSNDHKFIVIEFRNGTKVFSAFGVSKWITSKIYVIDAFDRIRYAVSQGLLDEELLEFYR